jgi:hypothetical protein
MTGIIAIRIANGSPTPGKISGLESSFDNRGLEE